MARMSERTRDTEQPTDPRPMTMNANSAAMVDR